jgi:hypothetical protein
MADMSRAIGRRRWAIAEGYVPPASAGKSRELQSHETLCILNASDSVAHIVLTVYFVDREPAGPYRVEVPAQRTLHLRTNELQDPEPVPVGTDYACVLEADVPVVVQHTRLDSREPSLALLSTVGFGDGN